MSANGHCFALLEAADPVPFPFFCLLWYVSFIFRHRFLQSSTATDRMTMKLIQFFKQNT